MFRFLGVLLALAIAVAGLGYYLGWFTVSTSDRRGNTNINVTVDKDKIKADEEAVKKKAEKLKEKAKSGTDK